MNSKVKNALIIEKVDASKVTVESKDGTVTLDGSVPTAAQKALAEKAAKQVAGVTSVKDNLTVGAKP
jgi:hyperosmotically inducible periplasmic protein